MVMNTDSHSISIVDATTFDVIGEINGVGTNPQSMILSKDEKHLFVLSRRMPSDTDSSFGCVYVVDIESGNIINTIQVGSSPDQAILSKDGRTLFVANSDEEVSEISLEWR